MKVKIILSFCLTILYLFIFGQSTNREIKSNLNSDIITDFKYIPQQYLVTNIYEGFDSLSIYYPRRSHVSEFYISAFELSNKDYKKFTNYVWDSIIHVILDYTKSIDNKKTIDWKRKVNWTDTAIRAKIFNTIGLKSNQRIFNKQELDPKFCVYAFSQDNYKMEIEIYPDTTCWLNNFIGNWNLASNLYKKYFENNEFENYPVVGISYMQALAYCNWKTQTERNLLLENSKYEVIFTLPTSTEWEAAANKYPTTIYKNNKIVNIKENYASIRNSHKLFYANEEKVIKYNYNFFNIVDANGYTFKEADEDGFFFTAPTNSYEPNMNGLYNMNGNVSEWILDDTLSDIEITINRLKNNKKNQKNETEELLDRYPSSLFAKLGLDSFSLRMKNYKITKGGSWISTPFYLQNGINQYFLPSESSNFIGCRIVAHFVKKY